MEYYFGRTLHFITLLLSHTRLDDSNLHGDLLIGTGIMDPPSVKDTNGNGDNQSRVQGAF
jgi:hypothetical protein